MCISRISDLFRDKKDSYLFLKANKIREKYCQDAVHLRGVIEFSNYCQRDCLYCGLRKSNSKLMRYRMTKEEIVESALRGFSLGIKTIVLQSGEDYWYTQKMITDIISEIKNKIDCVITLCLGEREFEEYKEWKTSGADRYLLKFETSNPDLYKKLHPDQCLDKRVEILSWLKQLNYQVGSGNIIGLPGQTLKDLENDIMMLYKLDVDMAGIGPFIPHPDTPFAKEEAGNLLLSLRVMAISRIILKNIHLPATTAIGSIDPLGREKALQAGANVFMPNITPTKFRSLYQIYPNKICIDEQPEQCSSCLTHRIASCGRTISREKGDSLKNDAKNT